MFPLLCVLLSGCSRTVTDFAFQAAGEPLPLQARSLPPKGSQGQLRQANAGAGIATRTTSRYTLRTPPTVTSAAPDFYIRYKAKGGPLVLHVYVRSSNGSTTSETSAVLPDPAALGPPASASGGPDRKANETVRYLLPLRKGTRLMSFRVTTRSSRASVHIVGTGLAADYRGVTIGGEEISLREGVALTYAGSTDAERVTTIRFPSLVGDLGGGQAQIVLAYTYGGDESGIIHTTARDSAGHSVRYLIEPRPGTHRLYLYTASLGFTPESLRVSTENPAFHLESVEINRFRARPIGDTGGPATRPIPADFGTVLAYQPDWWRDTNYELFSWSLVPSVVVVEFRTYAIQARYMKRLAFFVEKRGFAGKLWTNARLAGRHGWNAHDYRPEDLARFYSTAARQGFALNPEEQDLKTILLANGLITGSGDAYKPGKGAILTFAHVGPEWLRWKLLTHEGYHGIFFTHPAYRKAVFSIWNEATPEERSVFRDIFLSYTGYDITDPYLVKNEFQAYLMQQTVGTVAGYFRNELPHQMRVMGIPSGSAAARFVSTDIETFTKSAEEVQAAVRKAVGVGAGDLIGLRHD